MDMITRVKRLGKSKFFTYGLPFMIFMVAGSFGLKHFTSLRYEFRRSASVVEKAKKDGLNVKERVTLESEFEKMKDVDIENWKNIRGPRPWEKPT